MNATIRRSGRARERGAALFVSLVMLTVLTLVAVTSMRIANLEERMAGNTQDGTVALQAAEAALRQGEVALQQPALPAFTGAGFYPEPVAGAAPRWLTLDWESGDVLPFAGFADAPGSLSHATASFMVEQMPVVLGPGDSLAADTPVDETSFYRITARGVGVGGRAQSMLQTTFRR